MADSLGAVAWWGFTPAINILDFVDLDNDKRDGISILLIGCADVRHVLTTVARSSRRKTQTKLHFYMLESNLEIYARHMLFIALALEEAKRIGLQEKVELYLEMYGNTLIRQQSCEHIIRMANEFIKMITDFDYLQKKLPIIDCSSLKYKERDFLEGIFKFWRRPEVDLFDVEKFWDLRMRKVMGQRYDCRKNTYDWDYHMKLCDRQAERINREDYKRWRHTGVAFEIRDGTYDIPNKTLASGLILRHDGEKFARRGYWGDMVVSPYIAMSLESENQSLFDKRNGFYVKTSQEVAEYNMASTLYELTNRTKYRAKCENNSSKITEIIEEDDDAIDDEAVKNETSEESANKEYEATLVPNVKITFLPLNSLSDLCRKARYKHLFDAIYFSNSMVNLFTPEVCEVASKGARVIVETAKFILELKSEQCEEYVQRVLEMAKSAHCEPVGEVDASKDTFLTFEFKRT